MPRPPILASAVVLESVAVAQAAFLAFLIAG